MIVALWNQIDSKVKSAPGCRSRGALQERACYNPGLLQTSVAGTLPRGMDSNSQSPPAGAKKSRKMRQVIDEATWKAVEGAICVGGLGYSEAGRKFGIEPHAIMGKAKRNNWPLPSKIAERAAVLQTRYNRNGNEEVIQTEKAKRIAQLAFQIATGELKKIAKAPPASRILARRRRP